MKLAIQLYTLRDGIHTGDDLLKMLEEVKAMGFDGVEFAGYFGLPAEAIRAKLDELGLVAVGTHTGLDCYEGDKLAETIAYAKTLGLLYMGVGGAAHDTVAECEHVAEVLGNAQRVSGIPTYYHNHTEEFTPLEDGRTAMEIISGGTNLEIDTYWSYCAGVDNYEYIKANRDKIVLLHMKDGVDRHPKALCEGDCDLDAVARAARETGIEWIILENDNPEPDGVSDAKRSMRYFETLR